MAVKSCKEAGHAPDLCLGMEGGDKEAQARLIFRHPDLEDGRHVITMVHEKIGGGEGLEAIGKKDRHHASANRRPRVEATAARKIDKEAGILAQTLDAPSLVLHQIQSVFRRRDVHGREADAVDNAWQSIAEPLNNGGLACHEAATGGAGLRQRANDDVDLLRINPRVLPKTAALPPKHANRVRFVDPEPGLAPSLDLHESGEVGDVAIHAVKPFRDDQSVAVAGALLAQEEIEMVEVIVAENDRLGRRRFRPADDTIV